MLEATPRYADAWATHFQETSPRAARGPQDCREQHHQRKQAQWQAVEAKRDADSESNCSSVQPSAPLLAKSSEACRGPHAQAAPVLKQHRRQRSYSNMSYPPVTLFRNLLQDPILQGYARAHVPILQFVASIAISQASLKLKLLRLAPFSARSSAWAVL